MSGLDLWEEAREHEAKQQATIALLVEALQVALDDIAQREADIEKIRQALEAVNWNHCEDYYAECVDDALYIASHDRLKDGDPRELYDAATRAKLAELLEQTDDE